MDETRNETGLARLTKLVGVACRPLTSRGGLNGRQLVVVALCAARKTSEADRRAPLLVCSPTMSARHEPSSSLLLLYY